jgi:hypothetical protein
MALELFNAETLPAHDRNSQNYPVIAIDYKNGLFRINKLACEMIGLKPNDKLQFAKDKDNPNLWFMNKADNGYPLKERKNISGGLVFGNTTLARRILASGGVTEGKSGKVKVNSQSIMLQKMTFWPIDLSPLKIKK